MRYLDDAADVMASAGWDNVLTVGRARFGPRPARIIRGGVRVRRRRRRYGFRDGGAGDTHRTWRDRRAVQLWDLGTPRLLADVPFGAPVGEKNCAVYGARDKEKGG